MDFRDKELQYIFRKALELPRETYAYGRDPEEIFHLHLIKREKQGDHYHCWLSSYDPIKQWLGGYFLGFDFEQGEISLENIFYETAKYEVDWTFKPMNLVDLEKSLPDSKAS
jgi:hypothetical protein